MKQTISPRKRYYNPMMDPHVQAKMTDKMRESALKQEYDSGQILNEPDLDHPANLVSSLCDDGLHRPVLDIDMHADLVPSSTPGHYHLYFPDVAMSWENYRLLLDTLRVVGILETDYVNFCIRDRQSFVRPPGVNKEDSKSLATIAAEQRREEAEEADTSIQKNESGYAVATPAPSNAKYVF